LQPSAPRSEKSIGVRNPVSFRRNFAQQSAIGLSTKVALRPGKAVVLFDDEDQKITLKLTEL